MKVHSRTRKRVPRLAYSAMAGMALTASLAGSTPAQAQLGNASSWIGNTFGGINQKYVSNYASTMLVLSDGTCVTNTPWEEDGGEVTVYKNGDVLAQAGYTHGWGYEGGKAVAANANYYFLAGRVNNEGGNLNNTGSWPPAGKDWYGFSRRLRSNIKQGATFSGGKGGDGATLNDSFKVVGEVNVGSGGAELTGMYATSTELFVSDNFAGKIKVFDQGTLAFKREWTLARPDQMTMDKDGFLWIIQRGDSSNAPRVLKYNQSGTYQNVQITFVSGVEPSNVAYDNYNGAHRLMVTDQGCHSNIKIYNLGSLGGSPNTVNASLGTQGGVLAGSGTTIGTTGERRFLSPMGTGVDSSGNYYVSHSQRSTWGHVIESYSRASTPARRWILQGLCFVDNAAAGPGNDVDVYTKDEHYVMDYSKSAGGEWTFKGHTLDRFRFPNDPRVTNPDHNYLSQVVRFQNAKYLVVTQMHLDNSAGLLQLYRFDPTNYGELAIPSYRYTKKHQYSWGLWVDNQGNIWEAGRGDTIYKTPCTGKDSSGNPTYGTTVTWSVPAPFGDTRRLQYDAATGTMYISGFRAGESDNGGWKSCGTLLVRYNNWSGARSTAYELGLPSNRSASPPEEMVSWRVEKDHIFVVGIQTRAKVWVYNVGNGGFVGNMMPSGNLGTVNDLGWVDVPMGLTAHRRANGEYLVFMEDVMRAKVTLYRWSIVNTAGLNRIRNRYTGQYVNTESGLQSSNISNDWASAKWAFTVADSGFYHIRNAWTNGYLNSPSAGTLKCESIDLSWWSAQWWLESTDSGFYRIRNRYTGEYINVEGGSLRCSGIDPGWWSAQWDFPAA